MKEKVGEIMSKNVTQSKNVPVDKTKFIFAIVSVVAIVGILVYQMIQKIQNQTTSDLWHEIALIVVALLLFSRVVYVYLKEKKK